MGDSIMAVVTLNDAIYIVAPPPHVRMYVYRGNPGMHHVLVIRPLELGNMANDGAQIRTYTG